MTAAEVPTQQLAKAEKIALMERLWGELSADTTLNPPTWHAQVLASRTAEWEARAEVSENWGEAKKSLEDSV